MLDAIEWVKGNSSIDWIGRGGRVDDGEGDEVGHRELVEGSRLTLELGGRDGGGRVWCWRWGQRCESKSRRGR